MHARYSAGEISPHAAGKRVPRSDGASQSGSTKTQRSKELSIDHALGRHIVVAFVSANGSSRLRPQDPIDGSVIVASTGKPALYFHNRVSAVISVILVTVVIVRVVVPIIGIRIEDWKTERVEEDECSITEMTEMMCARRGPSRKTRCWPRHSGSRHHW